MTTVAVIDIESGNVRSALRAIEHVGADAVLTRDPQIIADADGAILPGVGSFGAVMAKLRAHRMDRIVERRIAGGRPVLAICVGLQIMCESSEESLGVEGLAQWPARVEKLNAPIVPHMGWSQVDPPENSVLFEGLAGERMYFVHSYAVRDLPPMEDFDPPLVTYATHGERFVAAVENGPLSATQFHPEKSGDAGLALLSNWFRSLT